MTAQGVSFSKPNSKVNVYDVMEVTVSIASPPEGNPFTDTEIVGWIETTDGSRRWRSEGFCDSRDGSIFHIRFMPPVAGAFKYFVDRKSVV